MERRRFASRLHTPNVAAQVGPRGNPRGPFFGQNAAYRRKSDMDHTSFGMVDPDLGTYGSRSSFRFVYSPLRLFSFLRVFFFFREIRKKGAIRTLGKMNPRDEPRMAHMAFRHECPISGNFRSPRIPRRAYRSHNISGMQTGTSRSPALCFDPICGIMRVCREDLGSALPMFFPGTSRMQYHGLYTWS